jgi:hypothetical protein
MAWWRRLKVRSPSLENDAAKYLKLHGDRACDVARQAARAARNKKDQKQARRYTYLALQISEMSKRERGL